MSICLHSRPLTRTPETIQLCTATILPQLNVLNQGTFASVKTDSEIQAARLARVCCYDK